MSRNTPQAQPIRAVLYTPSNDVAMEVLERQLGKHQTHVFTYKGNPVKQVNTAAWQKTLARAGISDFRWHDFRHTWASWHVQSGTPLHVLQELGGWECSDMVRRYAHLAPEHLAAHASNVFKWHNFDTMQKKQNRQ